MAEVFFSYAKEDRALATQAIAALGRAGYSFWWDDRLTPVEHWDRLIEKEIEAAKAVMVLWTADSVDSDWVRIEANYGATHAKLIQVRIGTCKTPLAYSMLQRVELAEGSTFDGPAWNRALDWIALLVGRGADAQSEVAASQEALFEEFFPRKDAKRGLFDYLFGLGRAKESAESGDLHVPLVLSIADAISGKRCNIGPLDVAATPESLRVDIPPGVAPGYRLRLAGKGGPRKGGGAGDLYLIIAVRDASGFSVEGRNIHGELGISVAESRSGTARDVDLPSGATIRVKVPSGVKAGTILRVGGRGLPGLQAEPAGDLHLRINIG